MILSMCDSWASMKFINLVLAVFILGSLTSCGRQQRAEIHAPGLKARKGVVEGEPIDSRRVIAGQTIYVPAYSSVFTSDRAYSFNLAVTLSIRNTDRTHSIVVTSASYYDQDGQLVRDYLKKSLRIGPMASTEFFVTKSDISGGVSASFLVEWVAEAECEHSPGPVGHDWDRKHSRRLVHLPKSRPRRPQPQREVGGVGPVSRGLTAVPSVSHLREVYETGLPAASFGVGATQE